MERRTALKAIWGAAGAAVAAVVALPGVSFFLDPLLRPQKTRGVWKKLVRLQSLPEEHPSPYAVVGERVDAWTRHPSERLGTVWLTRKKDGQVQALSGECPHFGCGLKYSADHTEFQCPCHASYFAPDGTAKSGPAPRAMDSLETKIDNGFVHVRFVKFRPQRKDKVEV